ncbi:MAG TPA: glycosyltransferase family 2 protein [Baekduia sp.]|uniref:glycosyltransferase family 2 protein n=1 Tax=Baekduia sp. TaxID=2600305 RepID=UPI002CB7C32F|nr:glycosyltransferase family 2 protein [Baekduia sp.]HMJ32350.1 glycosyltransferase family 2 protein [Baekduia sp.]
MNPTSNTTSMSDFGRERRAADRLSGLTIVLPCFDEAENLPDAVRYATIAAERCAAAHEIIVVDDGSTDETVAVAGRLAAADARVRLIVHGENRGYGVALRSGIAAAQQPWVLLIDADLQFDVGELAAFLPLAPSADLVVGWRILPQGPVGRRAGGALWNRVVRAAFDLPVRDVDCAFRLARRELLERLDLRAGGALVGAELLAKSAAAGARVAEVPVHHRIRVAGRQNGSGARLSARTLRELAGLRHALHSGLPPKPGA